ncbi:flagellar hook capping FlgD N-terminal domain-containing protein [Butyrivibrio sp. NC2002]|uniref:flagellar hook capping FlgD N-terminal domain-containing protein n=1 Tax=Butyrivibrio sp. NC2002 TaxID=1410610 RepID=UPI00068BEE32|nr:flagellar hook capping FlgD N-terminal domain-containing protein [Butyrivibrio sp. NC2002]
MSVNAVVQDGKILDTNNKKNDITTSSNNGYDKDAFMNILCAQMKYQDPLEPTSNTEYINQYATFTQVEQLSNMAEAFSMSRASELVGKTVIVTDENGTKVQGKVDYVTYSSGEAYLNIDGKDYKMDDVSSVADSEFVEIHNQVDDLLTLMDKFPDYNNLNFTDAQAIYKAYDFYQNMSPKAVELLDKKDIDKLNKYYKRVVELVQEAENNQKEADAKKAQEASSKDNTEAGSDSKSEA